MTACVVLGTAPCMWDDLARAPAGLDIVAINRAAYLYLEPIAMAVSIHGVDLVGAIERRRAAGADMDFRAYGNFAERDESGDVIRWNRPNGGGSSGLFTTRIALEVGYDKVVLAGVPLDGQTGVMERDGAESVREPSDGGFAIYRGGWLKVLDELREHVRSMSGWTRETFGEPTAEWLNSN